MLQHSTTKQKNKEGNLLKVTSISGTASKKEQQKHKKKLFQTLQNLSDLANHRLHTKHKPNVGKGLQHSQSMLPLANHNQEVGCAACTQDRRINEKDKTFPSLILVL